MERISSIKDKGKRPLEGRDDDEDQRERLRISNGSALPGVVIEARKVDCTDCSSLGQTIQRVLRVVDEKIQRALAEQSRTGTLLIGRSSPQRIKGPLGRNLQLQFKSSISLPLFTERKVEGKQGAAIHVVLTDANAAHVVTSGVESSVKLAMVVLEGDFNNADDAVWSPEEFDRHIVKERDGKRPLLIGDLQVTLKEGVGTLGDLTFTDNSSWIKSGKFRLGLKVPFGYCKGVRIREATTEAFAVKDRRGELYMKHYPPTLIDDVWRLEKIGKDGRFHQKLNDAGICTVEEFLRLVVRDSQKLREILGSSMSNKMWDALIEHAKTCALSGKLYIYCPDDPRNMGVVFNSIYELSGLIVNDQYYSGDSLSASQKVHVDAWVKKAYENLNQVVEYDGKTLMNFKQSKNSSTSQSDLPLVPVNHPHTYTSYNQLPPMSLPVSGLFGPSSVDQSMLVRGSGYNDNTTQPLKSNTSSQFEPTSSTQQTNQFPYVFDFAAGLPHSSPFDSSIQQGVDAFVYQPCNGLRSLSGLPLVPVNHPHTLDNQLLFGPSSVDENMLVGGLGCNDNMTQLLDSNTFSQFGLTSSTQQVNPNQITGCNDNMTQLSNPNICSQFEPAPSTQQVNVTNQITVTSNGNGVVSAVSPFLSPAWDLDIDVSQFPSPPWDNDADANSLISSLLEDCAPPPFDFYTQQDVDASEYQYWEDHQFDGIVEVC